jgi:hypothetical protein
VGITFDPDPENGTATLSGTPAPGDEGVYDFTLTASNGIGDNAFQDFTLTVATEAGSVDEGGDEISFEDGDITLDIPPGALEGEKEFIYVQQTAPSQPAPGSLIFAGITFNLTAINSGTGGSVTQFDQPIIIKIQYNPEDLGDIDPASLQLFYWDVDLTDWVDVVTTCPDGEYTRNLDEHWFSVPLCHLSEFAVMGSEFPNNPPVADDQSITTAKNLPVGITLTATDADGDMLTYQVVDGPSAGELTGTVPDLTYTPDTDFVGSDSLTFQAYDGEDYSNVATVSITVVENSAPVAQDKPVETPKNMAVEITLVATDADGDTLEYTVKTQPSHGILSGVAPVLTYTPTAGYIGPDSFTFTAFDGWVHSNEATVSITIFNRAPVAQDQTVQTTENVELGITLMATDADDDSLTYEVVLEPTNGVLSGDAPDLTYTPNTGFFGQDSFIFKANDGYDDSNEATITINVVEYTEAPKITSDDHATFTVGVDGSFTFTATGVPTPGISLTGTLPNGLTFTPGTGTAILSGTPAVGSARTYNLTMTANNGVNPNATQEFTLTINTPPVADAGPDQLSVFRVSEVTLDGSGSSDPDGDTPLTYQWEQISGTPVTLDDETAQKPSFTAPNEPVTLTFSLVVTDALGATSEAEEVVITVINRAPVANAGPDQTVNLSAAVTLNGSGSTDPDGDSLSYAWEQVDGDPTVSLSGADTVNPTFTAPSEPTILTFKLVVTDPYGLYSEGTVVITIVESQPTRYQIFMPLILK